MARKAKPEWQVKREAARHEAEAVQRTFDKAVRAEVPEWAPGCGTLPEPVASLVYGAVHASALADDAEWCQERFAGLVESIEREAAFHDHRVAGFVADVQADANHAFEWGNDAASAAARAWVLRCFAGLLRDRGPRVAYAVAQEHALRGARWPERSSSPMANLMGAARTAQWAELVSDGRTAQWV